MWNQQLVICKQKTEKIPGHLLKDMQTENKKKLIQINDAHGNLKKELVKVKEWKVRKLQICHNKYNGIVKAMSDVKFQRLTQLQLYNNNITTIEAISRFRANNLQSISFQKNKITVISAMKKLNLKNIKKLTFEQNFINEANEFEQNNWLEFSIFEIQGSSQSKIQLQNIIFLSKYNMQSMMDKKLWLKISSEKRILASRVKKCLQRKFLASIQRYRIRE